jgi:hypothetical protein
MGPSPLLGLARAERESIKKKQKTRCSANEERRVLSRSAKYKRSLVERLTTRESFRDHLSSGVGTPSSIESAESAESVESVESVQ